MTLHHIGNIYGLEGQWKEAIECFSHSLTICRELRDAPGIAATLGSLGNVFHELGDLTKAKIFYDASHKIKLGLNDASIQVAILFNIGGWYAHIGQWLRAEQYYIDSLEAARKCHDRIGEGWTLWGLSNLFEAQNNRPQAIEWARQALAVLEKTQDMNKTAKVRSWLARHR